jgi:hypothetical protein
MLMISGAQTRHPNKAEGKTKVWISSKQAAICASITGIARDTKLPPPKMLHVSSQQLHTSASGCPSHEAIQFNAPGEKEGK